MLPLKQIERTWTRKLSTKRWDIRNGNTYRTYIPVGTVIMRRTFFRSALIEVALKNDGFKVRGIEALKSEGR